MSKYKTNKTNTKLTVGFIVLAAVVCLLYSLWGQMNTAGSIYSAVFEYEGMENLLSNDADFPLGETALSAEAEEQAESFKIANAERLTEGNVTSGEAELSYRFWDLESGTTVILVHDYWSCGEDMLVYAPYWAEKGFNVLTFDMRGFGDSTGVTSLGYNETGDIAAVVATACPDDEIIIQGRGMGAVAALRLSDANISDVNVKLIIAEDAFTDLRSYNTYFCKREFSLPGFMVNWCCDRTLIKNSGFGLDDINAASAVAEQSIPCVFVAGESAEFVPSYMTEELYNACGSEYKDLLLVPDAGYSKAWESGRAAYEDVINNALAFIY